MPTPTASGSAPTPARTRCTARPVSGWTDGTCSRCGDGSRARNQPSRARTAWILGAKDHLFFRLTGEVATDPSTAAGFGCYSLASGRWNEALAGDAATKLPPVEPASFARGLHADVARALGLPPGLPVLLGAADSVCGALGAGAAGRVSLWGTSTAIMGVSADLTLDAAHRYLVTPLAAGRRLGSGDGPGEHGQRHHVARRVAGCR